MLKDILARVETRLSDLGITGAEASRRAGLSVDAIRNLRRAVESNSTRKGLSSRTIDGLARALGTTPAWLMTGRDGELAGAAEPPSEFGASIPWEEIAAHVASDDVFQGPAMAGRSRPVSRTIPVVGEVAAGRWLEAAALELHAISDFLPMEVQGYERAQLRAWRVAGPSVNLVYPEGRYVITAHPAEAGVRSGDFVIVQRHRFDLVEITLKEIVLEADGRVALWPRSNHPDYQTPIYLRNDPMDQTVAEIVGVVIADYARRVRPPL